jgi:indolepyruvate ferredoxin oxidoreductase
MMEEALRWMDLPEPARARLAQYVYDLFQWGGPDYARRYVTRLWGVYRKDQKERGFQATLAVLGNLHRVMAIKDEVYVARLLTGEEKHRRDRARYNVNEERGDRLDYVHLNRPNFTVLGRNIQFDWRSRQWQLQIMKHLGVLRRLLPCWHAGERAFRSWYEGIVDEFNIFADAETYRLYVEILSLPEEVRGYREIRAPKMDRRPSESPRPSDAYPRSERVALPRRDPPPVRRFVHGIDGRQRFRHAGVCRFIPFESVTRLNNVMMSLL